MDADQKKPSSSTKAQLFFELRDKLVSVAGLIGKEIINQDGQRLGTVADLVCRWDTLEKYPPLTGIIAHVDHRKVFIKADLITKISSKKIDLKTAKLNLREFSPRDSEVRLAEDVLDHQLIDVNGARVVRASDLYVSQLADSVRLVGVDVSFRSILRRLGPRAYRSRPTPEVVIDWATIQSFGTQDTSRKNLKLTSKSNELHKLRAGELADLLEDLGRDERRELLKQLPAERAADALEEMEAGEVEVILRESTTDEAAAYLSHMQPDEAADALRDVDDELRQDLIEHMTKDSAEKVEEVLTYSEDTAGGFMNTSLLIFRGSDTVTKVKSKLEASHASATEVESIVLVGANGRLIYDLPLVELLMVKPSVQLDSLIRPQELVTVRPDASIRQVAELLVESRRTSILVIDEANRPLGRIFADDVVDALLPIMRRFHFPRIHS